MKSGNADATGLPLKEGDYVELISGNENFLPIAFLERGKIYTVHRVYDDAVQLKERPVPDSQGGLFWRYPRNCFKLVSGPPLLRPQFSLDELETASSLIKEISV